MISFHNDNLVPPELCRLLYQLVPEKYHVPMVFTTRCSRSRYPEGDFDGFPCGTCCWSHIIVNLSPIWGHVLQTGGPGSTEFRLWCKLLNTSLHEFGHIATYNLCDPTLHYGYDEDREIHHIIEGLADRWAAKGIKLLADHDEKLGQPRTLGGYFGARLVKWRKTTAKWMTQWHAAKVQRVQDWRCYKVGAQFSAGDALTELGLFRNSSNYKLLRRLSNDIGIDYVDSAGRKHKLYTYGDLQILRARLPFTPDRIRVFLPEVGRDREALLGEVGR